MSVNILIPETSYWFSNHLADAVTLDRPKKFNALTLGMIREMHPIYADWISQSSPVKCIVLGGAGGKAFCAGGDVAAVQIASKAGGSLPHKFFYEVATNIFGN